jgi:hypothetical protein
LTRILEPALGGNAKTSIICTAAPEEFVYTLAFVASGQTAVLTSIFFIVAQSE